MTWPGVDLQLPLLQRELQVLSQKKSTYFARVACALGIFWYALTFGLNNWTGNNSLFWYLGKGRDILDRTVEAELFGVYVLIPAWMCSLIAAEKERQTLPLLLTTRLGIWRILFEKYCTGMLRVLVILLLSVPVLAIAYPLGGFTESDLLRGIWTVFICALLTGAITLFCSCWCATTAGAFLATYAILTFQWTLIYPVYGISELLGQWGWVRFWIRDYGIMWFYPVLFYFAPQGTHIQGNFWGVLGRFTYQSIPIFLQMTFFLGLSRWIFVTRTLDLDSTWFRRWRRGYRDFSSSRKYRLPQILNRRQPLQELPEDRPIAWRESRGAFLGTKFWVAMAILGSVIKYSLLQNSNYAFPFMVFTFCEFTGVALILVSLVTGLIQKERMRQTLDVLLVTPISTTQLLQQKLQRVWNIWGWFCLYLAILPLGFATGLLTVPRFMLNYTGYRELLFPTLWNYLFNALIHLPILIGLSLLISLYCKSQGKALITTAFTVVGWNLIPAGAFIMVVWYANLRNPNRNTILDMTDIAFLTLAWISPFGLHCARSCFESFRETFLVTLSLYVTTASWNLILLYILRARALNLIVLKLGRLEPPSDRPSRHGTAPFSESLATEGVT